MKIPNLEVKLFLLIVICIFEVNDVHSEANTDTSRKNDFIHFPQPINDWEIRVSAGLSVSYLPKIIVEEELNQSPLFDCTLRLGLPLNFSLNAKASTVFITNHFTCGLQWCHSFGDFSFSLGGDYAYWVGWFKQKGFNVVANGTIIYPYISIGIDFGSFLSALKFEGIVTTFEETFAGETTVKSINWSMIGYVITYSLEQPLWKKQWISQGIKLNITKFYYQSWLAFTKTENYIIFPEFFIGFYL